MKIRINYVSNSSSSSYVISYKENAIAILKSENGIEIEYKVSDFIREMEEKYETHSESTYVVCFGSKEIYEEAKEWWDAEDLKELKEFLDKNPDEKKMKLQINYRDNFMKKTLLNLYKLGLIDVFADEYDLRDDC